jgi:hypothetical protein
VRPSLAGIRGRCGWREARDCVGPPRDDGWNPIESAPLDEDIALQVTDGRGALYASVAMSANSGWLDQFEERNAAGGHAG